MGLASSRVLGPAAALATSLLGFVCGGATTARAEELARWSTPDGRFALAVDAPPPGAPALASGRVTSLIVRVVDTKADARLPAYDRPTETTDAVGLVGPPQPVRRPPGLAPSVGLDYANLTLTATMPGHGHGTFLKPQAREIAPGVFRVDGVKLHMRGEWQMSLSIDAAMEPVTVSGTLTI
jgi:hypothetical protein